ncbi:Longin-like domain-containing protein [Mycotypha africana]|uniref:Longin-like domain-containing protein n=1 Tax=Mycotypha africana TaxID=64632 RepID=UPI00230011D6|nr:Longin-like domain-containing protein [Mycotypha africana]KAI8991288.1 Longin-like domain-containing protein [Mycotypha africana]
MTIYSLYIFDRHCQCIYFQNWTHPTTTFTTASSRFSTSSATSNPLTTNTTASMTHTTNTITKSLNADANTLHSHQGTTTNYMTQQSGVAAGSVISLEEEAKLVYGVILSLRNFVRKLSGTQDGFISYRTSAYRLHYYETPTGLKFVLNSDPATENLRYVLKQIYIQLYVEFVVKNGLMRFDDTRWEIRNISNELFRVAVDRFIRGLKFFD